MNGLMAGEHTIHWVACWKLQKTLVYHNCLLHKTIKGFETEVCVFESFTKSYQFNQIYWRQNKLHQTEKCIITKVKRLNYCSIVVSLWFQ